MQSTFFAFESDCATPLAFIVLEIRRLPRCDSPTDSGSIGKNRLATKICFNWIHLVRNKNQCEPANFHTHIIYNIL